LQGEVIGISNLKAIAGDGVSFAIPIDTAKGIISQLLQPSGRVARPYIGCKTLELNSRWAQRLRQLQCPILSLQQVFAQLAPV
jgi:HtrA serine peptidase 2